MLKVIFTGTDPSSRRGGIGFALPGYLKAMQHANIQYESIPTYHPTALGGRWWWWFRALPLIMKKILDARKQGKKVVVYSHTGSGVSIFREGILVIIARLCGAKSVMQLHSVTVDKYIHTVWQKPFFIMAISAVTVISVLTPWWKKNLVSANVNKQIVTIPNPLPVVWEEKARETKKYGLGSVKEQLNILLISRIEVGKGVDVLVEAMQYLPINTKLIVAGDGSQLNSIKRQALELGVIDKIHFYGWVDSVKKQELLDEADIFCLPSSYDSFGMGFLEAMANGVPVVALNWGAISDVVPNGRVGILIKEKKPKILAEAIKKLQDVDLRKKFGEEGKKWVLENFSSKKVGTVMRKVFEEVAKS